MHNNRKYRVFRVSDAERHATTFFEDVAIDEYGAWAGICSFHSKESSIRRLGLIEAPYTCAGSALCDVLGCREEADYYIDFNKESIIEETESVWQG